MLFASPTFLFFFLPACLAVYFAVRGIRAKNAVLIGASLVFYAWGEPRFVPLIAAMALFNYGAALAIDAREGPARRWALGLAAAANLAVLGVFKYADFVVGSLDPLLAPAGVALEPPHIPLPLGISFFTFHCLSYLIDTFRRRFPANRRLSEVALYIALFPQLIAGPIVRYKTIARRLRVRRHSLGLVSAGLRIFVIGLAQKLLLADPLAPLANACFDRTARPDLLEAWAGTLAYALQIYFDFAGYSTMAIGLGLVFGFRLPRNFRTPYASRSITEFWRRWHISLSTWFRDYLYIPLGGNRSGAAATYRNLVVVFLLCGLWHGASWTFVLWGAWHGLFLVLERAGLGSMLRRAPPPAAWAYALIIVVLGWVLFRAPHMSQAVEVWRGLVGLNGTGGFGATMALAFRKQQLWAFAIGGLLAVFGLPRRRLPRLRLGPALAWGDNAASLVLLGASLLRIAAGTYSPFLYFRF
ncbi:MBOAT family O-acyltransferase [Phenylobacterium sp.]|uniref:MBOAT family O-acyltransferase n=1 Tax=Phenylobacterium sp. TaxID=1871053 RepID=UPI00262E5F7A|nr:MBOAT family O-acyltransferase [Phenylobacterium sp.]